MVNQLSEIIRKLDDMKQKLGDTKEPDENSSEQAKRVTPTAEKRTDQPAPKR